MIKSEFVANIRELAALVARQVADAASECPTQKNHLSKVSRELDFAVYQLIEIQHKLEQEEYKEEEMQQGDSF